MNVIFIEPSFPTNQHEFVRALHAAGANVIGSISDVATSSDGNRMAFVHSAVLWVMDLSPQE